MSLQCPLRIGLAALTLLVCASANGRTVTWTGAGGNSSWHNASNWQDEGGLATVPANGDDVVIADVVPDITVVYSSGSVSLNSLVAAERLQVSGGVFSISGSATLNAGMTLSSGQVSGTGTITIAGPFAWSGGAMLGNGTTVAQGPTSLTANAQSVSGSRTFRNEGILTMEGTNVFYVLENSIVENAAAWNIVSDADIERYSGTNQRFLNEGSFIKSGGTSETYCSVPFTNNGAVIAQSGTIHLTGGGSSSTTFSVATNTVIDLDSYTLNDGASVTGAGVLRVDDGILLLNGSVAADSLTFSGGQISGSGTLTIAGPFAWSGGAMLGNGTTVAQGPTSLTANAQSVSGSRTFRNEGTLTMEGTNVFYVLENSIVENAATWNIVSDADIERYSGTNQRFLNEGSFIKSGGTNETYCNVPFTTTFGSLTQSQSGTLTLSGGGRGDGEYGAAAGAILNFGGGTHSCTAVALLSGNGTIGCSGGTVIFAGTSSFPGTIRVNGGGLSIDGSLACGAGQFTGGQISGSGTLTIAGSFAWSGGNMIGDGSTIAQGPTTLTANGQSVAGNRRFRNEGMLTMQGAGLFYVDVNGYVENTASWEIISDADIVPYSVGTHHFLNEGSFTKSGGTSETYCSVPFTNNGAVNAQSGTIHFTGGGSSSTTFSVATNTVIDLDSYTLNDGASVTGAGVFRVNDGILLVNGSVAADSLTFSGGQISGSGTLTIAGSFAWSGGNMIGDGSTIAQGPTTLTANGQSVAGNRRFRNEGMLTMQGAGLFYVDVNGYVENAATWNIISDADIVPYSVGTHRFLNEGSFIKSGGTSETYCSVPFTNNGGTLSTSRGTLRMSGSYSHDNASIVVESASVAFDLPVTISGGLIAGSGNILGTITNGGTLSPGGAGQVGILHILGSLTQTSLSVMAIEIGGTLPGTSLDQVTVSGDVTLGGAIDVSVINTYNPCPGNSYFILDHGGRGGSDFDSYNGLDIGNGLSLTPIFNDSTADLRLEVAGTITDCNGNCVADSTDIAGGYSQDCNGNGTPDECDISAGGLTDENGNGIPDVCECGPAAIASPPVNTAVCEGHTAVFTVIAAGTPPFSYQWLLDGEVLDGETAEVLSIAVTDVNRAQLDGGAFSVRVSNACGDTVSSAASLTIYDHGPTVSDPPADQTACLGRVVEFSIGVTPHIDGAISYQWRKDGVDIAGATDAVLSFVVSDETSIGQYDCIVTEVGCGSTTSPPATLTVSNHPPVISLTGPAVVTLECHRDSYTEQGAVVSDDCDPEPAAAIIGGDAVDSEYPGTYVISYTATDLDGNVAQAARTVHVVDTAPPTVTLLGEAELELPCNAAYTDAGATAVDDCGGVLPVAVGGDTVNSGITGTYVVEYAATDTSGNTGRAFRIVRIVDSTPPVITLLGDNPLVIECGEAGYVDPGVQISDDCSPRLTPIIGGDSVNPLQPGTYLVTYDAIDPAGNAAIQVSRTVVIEDNLAPVISLIGDNPLYLECHGDSYVEPGAVAQDACEGSLSVRINGGDAVSVDAPTGFVITYDAEDSQGHPAETVTRTVIVVDTMPPTFSSPPADLTITCSDGDNVAEIDAWLASPQVADSCGTATLRNDFSGFTGCELELPVLFTAEDDAGNETSVLATLRRTPDATLADLRPLRNSTPIIIGPTEAKSVIVEFENTGICPVEISDVRFNADFDNPLLSSVTLTPLTVCPGEIVGIPVTVETLSAFPATYSALIELSGAAGSASAGLEITVSADQLPDLTPVSPSGIRVVGDTSSSSTLGSGESFRVEADLSNIGAADAGAFNVNFIAVAADEQVLLGTLEVAGLAQGAITPAVLNLATNDLPDGFYVVRVEVASPPEGELSLSNNVAVTYFQVGTPTVGGAIIVVEPTATRGCNASVINVTGRAYYLIVSDGGTAEFPVQGGRVTVVIRDNATSQILSTTSTIHTLTTGTFNQPVPAPPSGSYSVEVVVTDSSLEGESSVSLNDANCPPPAPAPPPPVLPPALSLDLWLCWGNISLCELGTDGTCGPEFTGNPSVGQPICVNADVSYYANLGGEPAPSLPPQTVAAYVYLAGSGSRVLLGRSTFPISGEGSFPVQFAWPSGFPDGEHVIEVEWEPTITQYEGNDGATRTLRVGNGMPTNAIVVQADAYGCSGVVYVSGRADYQFGGAPVSVGCGLVTATVYDGSGGVVGGPSTTRTSAGGKYSLTIFGDTPPGRYSVVVEVSDGDLNGLTGTVTDVYDCPAAASPDPIAPGPPAEPGFYGDVYVHSEDIVFLGDDSCSTGLLRNPEAGETVGINATVHFNQSGPPLPVTTTISAIEWVPVGSELVPSLIGTIPGVVLPQTGGVVNVCIPWTPATNGTRIIQVAVEPDFEQFVLNDAATRAITVGTATCELELDTNRIEIIAGQPALLAVHGTHSGPLTPVFNLNLLRIPLNQGLPAGLSFAFDPASPLTGQFESSLSISTDPTTPAGRYTLVVVASGDVCSAITPLTLIVRTPNRAPAADAGEDQTADEGDTVALDGSGSSDPDRDSLTYSWVQMAGPEVTLSDASSATPTFTAPTVSFGGATLTFQLVVADAEFTSTADEVNVTVSNVNHPPVAVAGEDQVQDELTIVVLNGSGSYDPDDDPLNYTWTQIAGTPVMLDLTDPINPRFLAPETGPSGELFGFELVVDDSEATATDFVMILVENVNHVPVANAGPDQTLAQGADVELDGALSTDPDGDPLSFSWIQISGPAAALVNADSANPTFIAPAVSAGGEVLVFELVVDDGYGGIDSDQVSIMIQDAGAPPACEGAKPSVDYLWPPNHKLIPVRIEGVRDLQSGDNGDDDGDDHANGHHRESHRRYKSRSRGHCGQGRVTITILSVTQDEPVNGLGDGDTSPDAVIQGETVLLRAERAGNGNGRVYHIQFLAEDEAGGSCVGEVTVCVPRDNRSGACRRRDGNNPEPSCIDDGELFDSLGG